MTQIHKSLKPFAVDIESLQHDPVNARVHTKKNIAAIKSSLTRFGQVKPIVLHKNGKTVIAGNGTLVAARELGWKEIAVVKTSLEQAEATAFGIADNRTAELATWDDSVLDDLLASLDQDLLMASGFDQSDISKALEDATAGEAERPGVIEYKVVVTMTDETAQAELMERLEKEGYQCQMLMT